MFFSIIYVGETREQAKFAGEAIRAALERNRLTVVGHTNTWPCELLESQRVRRDDDAMRPDGTKLFYGVDNYDLSIILG